MKFTYLQNGFIFQKGSQADLFDERNTDTATEYQ
jgi:hypothetical protein